MFNIGINHESLSNYYKPCIRWRSGSPIRNGTTMATKRSFDRLEVKFTRQAGDATRFAIEASNEGFDAIFAWVVTALLMKR